MVSTVCIEVISGIQFYSPEVLTVSVVKLPLKPTSPYDLYCINTDCCHYTDQDYRYAQSYNHLATENIDIHSPIITWPLKIQIYKVL